MSASKDPWLAINLSWTAAGLGPLYAGRRKTGIILLIAEAFLWGMWLTWALVPEVPLPVMIGAQAAILVLWISSAWASARRIRREFPPEEVSKTPWKAVFFTRFIPGAGHLYAGHWLKGFLYAALSLVLLVWPARESLEIWRAAGFYVARILILLDAFLILRRRNPAGVAWTGIAMGAILIGSQTWILFGAVRTFVVEAYRIPSSAMEPTLMGDVGDSHPRTACPFAPFHEVSFGDRILVSKSSYRFAPVQRFDVAVFKFPLNQSKSFVKRVVGLPGEELMIHAGDLYVRPEGGSRFEIVRKPLDVQDRIWIRVHPEIDTAADPARFLEYWRSVDGTISAGASGGVMLPSSPKGVEYRNSIDDGQGHPVGDVRLSLDVRWDKDADISARLVTRYGSLGLEFPVGRPGHLGLARAGKEQIFDLKPILLTGGQWQFLELMVYDGQAIVRLDHAVLGQFPLVTSLEDAKGVVEAPAQVSFGAAHDGVSVRHVRVDRDLHYRGKREREFGLREDEPLKIPANQYVCFGDNVANSHDSRAWVKRTFVLKDGRRIVCESQQVNEGYSWFNRELQKKHGLPEPPRFAIDGDEHGKEIAITSDQFLREEEPEAFRFVDRGFFVGRVVKIWWPLVRAGPVR
jgi:signal peptidase I